MASLFGTDLPNTLKLRWLSEDEDDCMVYTVDNSGYQRKLEFDTGNLSLHKPLETSSLGLLEKLPREILHMVLLELDVMSLRCFKATNSRAAPILYSVTEYNRVLSHAPGLVALLHYGQLTPYFSLSRVHTVLVQPSCATCNQFGGYVFLPGLQRCCLQCSRKKLEFLPITKSAARNNFGVRATDMEKLPKLDIASKDPKNPYNTACSQYRRTPRMQYLVSRTEAQKLGKNDRTGAAADGLRYAPLVLALMPSLSLPNATLVKGLCCSGCRLAFVRYGYHTPLRDLPDELRAQYLQHKKSLTGGQGTKSVSLESWFYWNMRRLHSQEQILSHFEECPEARQILDDVRAQLSEGVPLKRCEEDRLKDINKVSRHVRTLTREYEMHKGLFS